MNIDEIMQTIAKIAEHQGFYSKLYNDFMETKSNDPEKWKFIVTELERQNFRDAIDIIFYFET